jgi:hypothetical protein
MNCTICGQATLPGAMLCRPCKAALKRARYMSVQDLPRASILRPRRSKSTRSGKLASDAVAAMPAAPTPVPHDGGRRQFLVGAVAIAVLALVAYLGQQRTGGSNANAGVAPPLSVSTPAMPAAAAPIVPVEAAVSAAAAPPSDAGIGTATALAPSPVIAPSAATPLVKSPGRAPERTAYKPAPVRQTAEPVNVSPPVLSSPGVTPESFGPVSEPRRTAAAPPPPPVARPAPPPDRWQTMARSLARCDNEGGISGFICSQRVRIESCGGYWGRVPQCPSMPENPGR